MPVEIKCKTCGKIFTVKPSQARRGRKFCSNECRKIATFKGRFIRSDGYVAVWYKGKYELEHRVIMSKFLGRDLQANEQVHHRNEIKSDNRFENLEIVTCSEHIRKYHRCQRDESTWGQAKCLSCGKIFDRRKKETGLHKHTFCSRECYIRGRKKGICP